MVRLLAVLLVTVQILEHWTDPVPGTQAAGRTDQELRAPRRRVLAMKGEDEISRLEAELRNAAWFVRHYARGRKSAIQGPQRAQAIQKLGLTVRHAFGVSDEFERLLIALVESLTPDDYEPPF